MIFRAVFAACAAALIGLGAPLAAAPLAGMGAASMKTQKDAFKISAVRSAIARRDQALANHFDCFYQRSIDFGGHPNPHATFTAALLDEGGGETAMVVLALSTDRLAITHALLSTAQVGLTALCILQHVFEAKFEVLGIRQDLDALKNSGLL